MLEVSGDRFVQQGSWDSINVVEVTEESASKANYKLTTTIILHMGVDKLEVGTTTLSGSLTRQVFFNFDLKTKKQLQFLSLLSCVNFSDANIYYSRLSCRVS